jgi:membrane peptidoglycan carboxypeptidase
MSLKTQFATAAAVVMVAVLAYEGIMVWRAEAETPAILAEVAERPVTLAMLTPEHRALLLAVEDPSFYRNPGVDFSSPGQGMTTLTQALVKRLYFENFKSGFAKIEQTLIARYVLAPAMSKDDLLEVMLNQAYFGHVNDRPVIGFSEAAGVYYNTSVEGLSDQEFASLVAMLIAPNALDPIRHARENTERVARINQLMAGRCQPDGVLDVWYEACAPATLAAQ